MLLFSVKDVSQAFNGKFIFEKIDFEVNVGEKVALVGPNVIGKTSLLKIIAGIDRPISGKVTFFKTVASAFLNQNPDLPETEIVRRVLEVPELKNDDSRIAEALKIFEFTGLEEHRVADLSGGEKTRLQLAKVWLSGSNFLILDEPSNHLDTANLTWLEEYLQNYRGTLIVVSHDRYFLDHTVSRVVELSATGVSSHPGNYSAFRRAKQEQFERDTRIYFEQEKQLQKLDTAITEQKSWATRAHHQAGKKAFLKGGMKPFYRAKAKKLDKQVHNKINRLERLKEEQIARPKQFRTMDLSFTAGRRAKNSILSADRIAKSWDERTLFHDVSFNVNYGERIGLIGPNGSGKTTLLKIIYGMVDVKTGHIWRSPTLHIGYLDQETNLLNEGKTVLEEVMTVCSDQRRVRNLLADLLLRGETVFKPCRVLSMGERVRVALAKLLLIDYDLLLLDEPTNYLDLESREKLEEALSSFGGAMIVISHDRYLMEQVAETIWDIQGEKIQIYPGRYSEYLESSLEKHSVAIDTVRLELEFKKAQLIGELAGLDRVRNETEYLRLETEYLETVKHLNDEIG